MKFGVRVYNMCLRWFLVEISRYDFPRTIQEPLRRTLSNWWQHCLGSVHRRDAGNGPRMDRRGIIDKHKQTLSKMEEAPTGTSLWRRQRLCRTEVGTNSWLIDGPSTGFRLWGLNLTIEDYQGNVFGGFKGNISEKNLLQTLRYAT